MFSNKVKDLDLISSLVTPKEPQSTLIKHKEMIRAK